MHNCTALEDWDAAPTVFPYAEPTPPPIYLPSDPDIAGIGVVIAFVASAYMTLVLVLVYYGSGCIEETRHNPIDRGILRVIRKWLRLNRGTSEVWEDSIRRAVLMFSDQQLVTGLAILGSGFAQLQKGITAYHWQITVYLAWFSSLTHLTLLTVLRDYFRQHSGIRNWRLALMTATLALLIAALVPTGARGWMSHTWKGYLGAVPTRCFLQRLSQPNAFNVSTASGLSMVLSIVILVFGYVTRAIKLSATASAKSQKFGSLAIGKPLRWVLDKLFIMIHSATFKFPWVLLYVAFLTIYAFLRMARDFYTSLIGEVLWLTLALLWGSLHLFFTRATSRLNNVWFAKVIAPEEDNVWSFGQCIAVILLAFPLISIGEAYLESKHMNAHSPSPTGKGAEETESLRRQGTGLDSLDSGRGGLIRMGVTRLSNIDKLDITIHEDGHLQHSSYPLAKSRHPSREGQNTLKAGVRVNIGEMDLEDKITNVTNTAIRAPHYWDLYNFEWYRMLVAQSFLAILGIMSLFLSTVASVDVNELIFLLLAIAICLAALGFWTSTNILIQIVPLMRRNQLVRRVSSLDKIKRNSVRVWMYLVYLALLGVTQWCATIFVYSPRWNAGSE